MKDIIEQTIDSLIEDEHFERSRLDQVGLGIEPRVWKYFDLKKKGKYTYTIYVAWRGNEAEEEIDVLANDERQAREIARKVLNIQYKPGWKIVGDQERVGLYM